MRNPVGAGPSMNVAAWSRGPRSGADDQAIRKGATLAIHVVLVHPEIHWNTGNAGRSCLAVGATLHLIEPLGFSLDERQVKRAGLDYWQYVDLRVWKNWELFERELPALGDACFFTRDAPRVLWDAPLEPSSDVVLIFGCETRGLPAAIRERYEDRLVALPVLSPHVRSLNLSTTVGIALYEVLRARLSHSSTRPRG
jgi:tRNA (cytidine/uridine-2'-O-)-methyltransferase